jgi:hypothetical protein
MDKKITKLSVFDFDQTIVNTPIPENGKVEYRIKTGKEWPHVGWWGRPETLDMDIFDITTNPIVKKDYKQEKSNESTLVVLLTGRMGKLGDLVKKITDSLGLFFDEYHFNYGGTTEVFKTKTLSKLLEKYVDIDEVELWDDRESHVVIFEAWGAEQLASGRIKTFKLNIVKTENPVH